MGRISLLLNDCNPFSALLLLDSARLETYISDTRIYVIVIVAVTQLAFPCRFQVLPVRRCLWFITIAATHNGTSAFLTSA